MVLLILEIQIRAFYRNQMFGLLILVRYQVYEFFRKGMVLHAHFITVKIKQIVLIM